jgi:hypothetical protein
VAYPSGKCITVRVRSTLVGITLPMKAFMTVQTADSQAWKTGEPEPEVRLGAVASILQCSSVTDCRARFPRVWDCFSDTAVTELAHLRPVSEADQPTTADNVLFVVCLDV